MCARFYVDRVSVSLSAWIDGPSHVIPQTIAFTLTRESEKSLIEKLEQESMKLYRMPLAAYYQVAAATTEKALLLYADGRILDVICRCDGEGAGWAYKVYSQQGKELVVGACGRPDQLLIDVLAEIEKELRLERPITLLPFAPEQFQVLLQTG